MSILSKKLYVQKTGGTAVACNIYSTLAEAGDKALRVRVDNTDGYIALKATDDANATGMRVKIGGIIYAVATKHENGGDVTENVFVMTMGQQSGQYGYSRNNGNYGEVTGNVTHDGRAVTLVILSYYGGWLDIAFKEEGVTSGSRNIALNITPMETGVTVPLAVGKISYQGSLIGFYTYVQRVPSNISSMFTAANVGKKYKVEIVFN